MKLIKHGVFYQDTIKIKCLKCQCEYEIDKSDIKKYDEPKKVPRWGFVTYNDKYDYYTNCPDCNYDNELDFRNYAILTTDIKKDKNAKASVNNE